MILNMPRPQYIGKVGQNNLGKMFVSDRLFSCFSMCGYPALEG